MASHPILCPLRISQNGLWHKLALVLNTAKGYSKHKHTCRYIHINLPHVKPGLLQPPVLQVRVFCCAIVSGPSNSLNPASQVWVATLAIFRTTLLPSSEYLTVPLTRVSSGHAVCMGEREKGRRQRMCQVLHIHF